MRKNKPKKKTTLSPRFKLWLDAPRARGGFGEGRCRLLQVIEATGSLSAAAKLLRISYRKAWGDLQKAERCLNTRLIQKKRGGSAGGYTQLTEAGRMWLAAYSQFRHDIEKAAEKSYKKHLQKLGQ